MDNDKLVWREEDTPRPLLEQQILGTLTKHENVSTKDLDMLGWQAYVIMKKVNLARTPGKNQIWAIRQLPSLLGKSSNLILKSLLEDDINSPKVNEEIKKALKRSVDMKDSTTTDQKFFRLSC